MLSGEVTNTNFIVFGLTRPGLEPTIYRSKYMCVPIDLVIDRVFALPHLQHFVYYMMATRLSGLRLQISPCSQMLLLKFQTNLILIMSFVLIKNTCIMIMFLFL